MRHELDDEGRREFFEEQEEDVEGGSRGGNERWASASKHPKEYWIPPTISEHAKRPIARSQAASLPFVIHYLHVPMHELSVVQLSNSWRLRGISDAARR